MLELSFQEITSDLWIPVAIVLVFLFSWLVSGVLQRIVRKSRLETTLQKFAASAVKIVVWFIALIIVAAILGIPVTSLVALFSIAGLALSLSIQSLLANIFSGMTLLASKPFVIGDFVDMCGISGTIREVGLINTTLTTADNRVIFIPNSDITGGNITNYTREPNRRVDLVINAAYDSEPDAVIAVIREVLAGVPGIHEDPEPFIALSDYGERGIEYTVRVWTSNTDYWNVNYAIKAAAYTSFASRGIDMTPATHIKTQYHKQD